MSCFTGFASSSGVTSGGTLCQLLALGTINQYLNLCPSVTFWRTRIQKCTNFAMESIMQTFTGNCSWGSEVQINLNRTGDLIYWMYVLLDIPAIRAVKTCNISNSFNGQRLNNFPFASVCDACDDGRATGKCSSESGCCGGSSSHHSSDDSSDQSSEHSDDSESGCCGGGHADDGLKRPFCNWVDSIGFAAIQRAAFAVGGQVIDTVYSHYLNMWEELSGKPGKRLEEMIGHTPFPNRAQLIADSQRNRRLYVPLPFYFTEHSGNAFPLVSCQFHTVQVHINFAPLEKLIQVSDCDVMVVKCCDGQPIGPTDMRSVLDTTYVYLDKEERDRFAVGCFLQLITQVQHYAMCGNTSEQLTAQLNFNLPSLELMWAVQRQCQANANNTFNYSGKFDQDPIKRAKLLVNNLVRFDREAQYFRLVQPYQHHSSIPHGYVYSYSFALFPEDCDPSGAMNFSKIDNIEFSVCLQPELAGTPVNMIVFNRVFNIVRFRDGLSGTLFVN